ncbi:hypothetical protein BS47DRAFT_1369307 [Hydnum rufescens UP504]|uniref:Uncharacterized protein n=1 Tax=Hydnum rufescens UP504 TaxID=1448309 RepID=A0A9P6DM52_9AGAM|nr:hypothetical protein BS47DRAFT_1369307 [Hydnum rufescens UP504]
MWIRTTGGSTGNCKISWSNVMRRAQGSCGSLWRGSQIECPFHAVHFQEPMTQQGNLPLIVGPKWELNPGIPTKDEPRVIKMRQPRSCTSGFNEWFDPSTTARLKSTDEAYHYGSRSPSGYRGRPGAAILTNETLKPGHGVIEPRKPNTIDKRVTRTEVGNYGVAQTPPQVNLLQGPNAHEARPKQRARLESSIESITRNSALKVSRKTGGSPRPHLQVWTNVAGETIKVDTNLLRTVSPKDARHLEPVAWDVRLTRLYHQKAVSPTKASAVRGTAVRIMFASHGRTIPKLATGQSVPEYRDICNDPYKSKPVPVTGDRLRYLTIIRQGVPVETGGHRCSAVQHVLNLPASNDQLGIAVAGDDDGSLHLLRWNTFQISDCKIDVLNRVPIWSLVQAEQSGDSFQAVIMVFQSSHSFPWHGFRNLNQLGVQTVLDKTQKDLGSDPQDNETVSKGPEALTTNARKPYSDILKDSGPLIPIRAYMTLIRLQGARKGTDCLPFGKWRWPFKLGRHGRPPDENKTLFTALEPCHETRKPTDSRICPRESKQIDFEPSVNSTRARYPIETEWKRDVARFHRKFNLELGTKDDKRDVRPTGSSLQVSLQPLNGVIHPAYEGTMDLVSGFTTRLLSMSIMVKNLKYLKDWSPRMISKGLGELGITLCLGQISLWRSLMTVTRSSSWTLSQLKETNPCHETVTRKYEGMTMQHRYYRKYPPGPDLSGIRTMDARDPELDPRSNKTRPRLLAPTEALSLTVECRLPDIDAAKENELLSWNSCLQAVQSGVTQLPPRGDTSLDIYLGITLSNLESVGPNLLHDSTRILENNLADLTLEAVIEYCSSRRVYEPFDTFMSEFGKPIPKNFEPLQMYRNMLKDSGQQARIEVLNLHTSHHQLSIVMTKNNRRLLRGCGQQMEEYDTTR